MNVRGDGDERWGPGWGWMRRSRGATATEYVVILVLASLGVLVAVYTFGGGLGSQYEEASAVTSRVAGEDVSASARRADGQEGDEQDDDEFVHTGEINRQQVAIGDGPRQEEGGGPLGGINPLILLLVVGGALVVGYILLSDDDE